MGGSENKPLAVRKEKPASRATFPAVEKFHVTSVDVHAEDLIALKGRPGGLEDQFCAVEGKIRFSILPAKGELLQVPQIHLPDFLRRSQWRISRFNNDVTDRDQRCGKEEPQE